MTVTLDQINAAIDEGRPLPPVPRMRVAGPLPGDRPRVYQREDRDCFRAAVASVLRAEYDDLPAFHGEDYEKDPARFYYAWGAWLWSRGIVMTIHRSDAPTHLPLWIASVPGFGVPDRLHAVVMSERELVHDPSSDPDARYERIDASDVVAAFSFAPRGWLIDSRIADRKLGDEWSERSSVESIGVPEYGSAATRAGSLSTNIVRETLTTTPVAICHTGQLPHVGKKKLRTRVYASATKVWVRASWRVGDARFQPTPWREVPAAGNWFDIALDVIDIQEVPEGTHSWQARIEAYTDTPGTTIDVDQVEYLPADAYAHVRAPVPAENPTVFSARDEFDQSAGALNGKTLPVGGTWATSGDTTDYAVESTGHTLRRVSSTTGSSGRLAVAGSTTFTNVVQAVDTKLSTGAIALVRQGLLLRYVNASDYLEVSVGEDASADIALGLFVRAVVAGSVVYGSATEAVASLGAGGDLLLSRTLRVVVLASGVIVVWWDGRLVFAGQHSSLATGGALASGKAGLFDIDATGSTSSLTRTYDNFAVWVPQLDHALFSGQSAKLQHDRYLRENSAGTRFGRLPIEGKYLRVAPSSESAQERRFVIKRRRLDNDGGLPDQGTSDAMTADLVASQRVSLI